MSKNDINNNLTHKSGKNDQMLSCIVSGDDNTEEALLAGHFGPSIQTVEPLDWSKPQTLNCITTLPNCYFQKKFTLG